MGERIRILLVDDHAVLRAGLKALLDAEPDFRVVGEASNGEEAVFQAKQLRPDVIVMDLTMPEKNGLEATAEIVQADIGSRVLVLTVHEEEEFLLPVLEAGGSGYVRKTSADKDLTQAIRTVARGEVFLYPRATTLLLKRYKSGPAGGKDPLDVLSDREREVLALTAQGFSSSEIGEKLFISPKTVDTYRSRIMEKLTLNHRSELIKFALKTGLLKSES